MRRTTTLSYFAANVGPRLSTFAALLVLTRLLPMDDYGMYALVVTTGEILDMAAGGWVRLFVLSNESRERRPTARRIGRSLILTALSCLLSLTCAFVLATIQPTLAGRFTIAVSIYLVAFVILRFGLTMLQTQQRHGIYAAAEISRGFLSLVGSVGAVWLYEPTFLVASLGVSLSALFVGIIASAMALRGLPRPIFPTVGYRAALIFGFPIVSVTMLAQIVGWVDRFILNDAFGPASVGLYAAAFALARQPVELFSNSLNPFLFPNLVRIYASEGAGPAARFQAGNLLSLMILCGAAACGVTTLTAPFAKLLLPPAYWDGAIQVMPWIAFATLFNSLKNFCFDNVFYVTRTNWRQFWSLLPSAAISLAAGVLLIPTGGPIVAGMIAACSALVSLGCSALLSLRLLPLALPRQAIVGVMVSLGLASATTWSLYKFLSDSPILISLAFGIAGFVVVYGITLTVSGFDLLRLLDRPWEVWRVPRRVAPPIIVTIPR
jgi:O-antigen/teichoic acid export membrane protein